MYTNMGIQLYLLGIEENIKCINRSIIPKAQLKDISRYKREVDVIKRLLTRSFLYEFLNKYYSITDFELGASDHFKPFFKGVPNIHFSFSYAKDYVFIAINNSKIGVDIEYIDPDFPVNKIAPDIMCESELEKFNTYPENSSSQHIYFYKLFSAKEAIIKAFGTGLHYDIKQINTIENKQFIYQGEKFMHQEFDLWQNSYSMSICYQLEV